MNLFRSIKDFLLPPLDEPKPAFSKAERRRLERLTQEDGFTVFLEALDKEVQIYAEQLTSGQLSAEQIQHLLGVIRGLREGPKLINRILKTGADFDEYRKHLAARSANGADAIRAFSYGSPFWDRQ